MTPTGNFVLSSFPIVHFLTSSSFTHCLSLTASYGNVERSLILCLVSATSTTTELEKYITSHTLSIHMYISVLYFPMVNTYYRIEVYTPYMIFFSRRKPSLNHFTRTQFYLFYVKSIVSKLNFYQILLKNPFSRRQIGCTK